MHNEEAQEDEYAVYLSWPNCIIDAHCSCGARPGSCDRPRRRAVVRYLLRREQSSDLRGRHRRGAEVPADYELAPVPDVVVTKYPKLKKYRYVRIGKRTAIVSPTGRKVVKFLDRVTEAAPLAGAAFL